MSRRTTDEQPAPTNQLRAVLHFSVMLSLSLGLASGCEKEAPAASSPLLAAAPSPRSAGGSQGAAPSSGSEACGNAGQPRCPLQEWMRATLQAYLVREDTSNLPRIATALDKLASGGPAEYS